MSRVLTDKKMLIKELSIASGFSKDTLRYYEKLGIIRGIQRQDNGYREYDNNALLALEIVHLSKDLGFTLHEIKSHVGQLVYKNIPKSDFKKIMKGKLHEIDKKIEELNQIKGRIHIMIESYSAK